MSAKEVKAWVITCDIVGCDERTGLAFNHAIADEDALEAGWLLDEDEIHDLCPRHAGDS